MMNSKNVVLAIFSIALLVLLAGSVSAFGTIDSIQVSGVQALDGTQVSTFTGQTIPVRVIFTADSDASDVRIKAWISGESQNAATTERFDALEGNVYSRLLAVDVPSTSDPNETIKLEVVVESRNNGVADSASINLIVQRESYNINVLDVIMDSSVSAGDTLPVDIVLRNAGRQNVDNSFVTIKIPSLNVEQRAYFGDLSPVDQDHPTMSDAVERRMFVRIPSNSRSGVYNLEVKAYDSDSSDTLVKKVEVTNGGITGMTISSGSGSRINWPLLITVVLAIIFIVLLVVLIVLLVRKPAESESERKEEDYGESYY